MRVEAEASEAEHTVRGAYSDEYRHSHCPKVSA